MANPTVVDPADPARRNSEILGPTSDEATVQMSEMDEKCYWNDVVYEQGASITTGNASYVCSFGKWIPSD